MKTLKTLPGLKHWNMYGGDLRQRRSDASSYRSFDIETQFGKYSISPVSSSSGRFAGYSVYKYVAPGGPPYDYNNVDLMGNGHYAWTLREALKVARKDYETRRRTGQARGYIREGKAVSEEELTDEWNRLTPGQRAEIKRLEET